MVTKKEKKIVFGTFIFMILLPVVGIIVSSPEWEAKRKELNKNLGITYGKIYYISPARDYRNSVGFKFMVNDIVYFSEGRHRNSEHRLVGEIGSIYKVHYSLKDPLNNNRFFIDSLISSEYDTIDFDSPKFVKIKKDTPVKDFIRKYLSNNEEE